MDRNTIKKEIMLLVSSIKSQSDTLENEKYPSQVDLELFLHKVEKLYQKSIVFNHLSLFDGFEEVEPQRSPVISSAPVPVATSIIKKEESSLEVVTPPAQKLDQPVEQKSAPEKSKEEEAIPVAQKIEQKPISETKTESLKSQKQLPDLKSAMGINDKFQFTNELFKGNMPEFNIAIEQLNAADSIESAMDYLKSLHHLYEWDEEHDTVKRLLSIIEKRYT
jgi:hypothetical protein